MSAYEKTKDVIRDTISEFGGQAHNIEEIIVDRIKEAGLKIEYRANAKPDSKPDTEPNEGEGATKE